MSATVATAEKTKKHAGPDASWRSFVREETSKGRVDYEYILAKVFRAMRKENNFAGALNVLQHCAKKGATATAPGSVFRKLFMNAYHQWMTKLLTESQILRSSTMGPSRSSKGVQGRFRLDELYALIVDRAVAINMRKAIRATLCHMDTTNLINGADIGCKVPTHSDTICNAVKAATGAGSVSKHTVKAYFSIMLNLAVHAARVWNAAEALRRASTPSAASASTHVPDQVAANAVDSDPLFRVIGFPKLQALQRRPKATRKKRRKLKGED